MMPEVVYLIEATVYDPALLGTRVLRYCSGVGCVVNGNYYEPRIKHPGRLKRMLFAEGKTSGPGQIGYGEVVLVNADGALDALTTYGFDGRQLMIKRALAVGAVLTAVVTLAACSMEQATSTWDEVAIRVRDRKQELNVPLQANKYGGSNALPNGLDGTSDIQGKPKPLLFGVVKNATPVCVNTSKLIYQLHDGALASAGGVYDKGVPLTAGAAYSSQADMEANAPAAGQYRAWLAGGMFRLGAAAAGQITADATEGATALERSGAKIAERIASRAILPGDISAADVTALHTANGAEIGYYSTAETTVAAALDEVLSSVGGWYGFDATGKLRMGRLDAPAGSPVGTLTEAELLSIERTPTSDESRGVPVWRVNLGYDRNWSPAAGGWADSVDLAPWSATTLPNAQVNWWDVAYGAGLFVAVGAPSPSASALYVTSPDGVSWTQRSFPVAGDWRGITYGNGLFVAIASNSNVALTSPDGLTWTQRTLPATTSWKKIAYGNGVFVVNSASNIGATSPDGITWTNRTLPATGTTRLSFGNGLFVLVRDSVDLLTSTDGITWTARSLPTIAPSVWVSAAYGSNGWYAVGSRGELATSADGITWSFASTPNGMAAASAIIFANNRYLVIGSGATSVSADGVTWRVQRLPSALTYTMAGGGGGVFVVGGWLGNNVAAAVGTPDVGTARTLWLSQEYRTVTASDAAVQVVHPLARELATTTLLVNPTAAQTEAARLLALHSVDRVRLRVKVARGLLPAELLGQPVLLQLPRYDYAGGKLLLVIGLEEDCGADTLILDLWG